MSTRSKLRFAALAAAATMLTLVASASARNLSVSEREFEILFRELTEIFGTHSIACPLTLLGHFFERTIPKIVGTQVGVIRHADPLTGAEPPCTESTITILNATLPWRIDYNGFSGTLPHIEAIRLSIIGIALRFRPLGAGCLEGTTAAEPLFGELLVGTGGRVEGFRVDENRSIRLGGGFLCTFQGSAFLRGTGTVLNLPGTRSITLTLI